MGTINRQGARPVFTVGDNIISSLGFTTDENIASLLEGRTGLKPYLDPEVYPECFLASSIDKNRMKTYISEQGLEEYSDLEAWMILSVREALGQTKLEVTGEDTVFLFSSTKGDITALSGDYPPEENAYLWKTAGKVCAFFGITTRPLVVSNACVSGVYAVELGARLLRAGHYRKAIVVGADRISGFTVSGFQSFKSISSLPCKPFDKERDGLSIGEGVASLVLSSDPDLYRQDRSIYIRGGATSNDANHISGPSRTGDGLHKAIEEAIAHAGIRQAEIDFINLHGTATVYNDEMESKALALSGLSATPVNSLKGYWGHTLGASGVMEIVASIESLRRNQLIATLGFSSLGVPEPLCVIDRNEYRTLTTCLKTASGFGGFNSAVVLSKESSLQAEVVAEERLAIRRAGTCCIQEGRVEVNGQMVYAHPEEACFDECIKGAFKALELAYPKFYKMDRLSKLGFVAMQYLLQAVPGWEKMDKGKIALVFSNSASSLDTDIRHRQSIRDSRQYFPSPSVFVYTLPNIVLGEICIKEKIQGEATFFLSEKVDPAFMEQYLRILLSSAGMDRAVCGRLECLGEDYHAELYLVEREGISTKKV